MGEQEIIDGLRGLLKQRLAAIAERDALVPAYEEALGAFQKASAVVNDLQAQIDALFADLRAKLEVL